MQLNNHKNICVKLTDDIIAHVGRAYEDGSISFILSSPKLNTTSLVETDSLENAPAKLAILLTKLTGHDAEPIAIMHKINDLYHGYMKELLKRFKTNEVYFTGGTIFDYQ